MLAKSVLVPLAVAAVVAIAALALASHGTSGGAPAAAGTVTTGPIVIKNFMYLPANATVKVGTRLTFADRDTAEHTATADGGGFDTGSIQIGQQKTITLGKAGTYAFHCDFHPFMHGSITVR